jgi:hypothetical protein
MEGSARIQIGEEINHNCSWGSTSELIIDCLLRAEIIGDYHDVATVENEHMSDFSLDDDIEKVPSRAALYDLVVAEIKNNDNNSEDGDKLKLGQKPFSVNVIDFENKKVLVRAHLRESTKGKKTVIASDEYRAKIVEFESTRVNLWKKNSTFCWEVQSAINEGRLIFTNHNKTAGME